MTREEKEERLRQLGERQLKLLGVMKKSDDHASKCIKLGVKFKSQYPEEYEEYAAAREEYNSNETLIAEVEAEEPDDEIFEPAEE